MDGIVGVMTPETAQKLMRRFESGHPMSEDRGTPIDLDAGRPRTEDDMSLLLGNRVKAPRFHISMSDTRAKIAAMNRDAVSAALWALSSFDPALAQLAELREHFLHTLKLDEEDQLRITLDRLIFVYVEGQCRELLNGAEITTDQANVLVEERIGDPSETAMHILACTDDPLAMELNGYALWLGSLTAHGKAPWSRFAWTMADCYYKKHPLAS